MMMIRMDQNCSLTMSPLLQLGLVVKFTKVLKLRLSSSVSSTLFYIELLCYKVFVGDSLLVITDALYIKCVWAFKSECLIQYRSRDARTESVFYRFSNLFDTTFICIEFFQYIFEIFFLISSCLNKMRLTWSVEIIRFRLKIKKGKKTHLMFSTRCIRRLTEFVLVHFSHQLRIVSLIHLLKFDLSHSCSMVLAAIGISTLTYDEVTSQTEYVIESTLVA